jgi:hypothetical protein
MNLKDDDYVLEEGAGWFTVKGFSVRILSTDEGLLVDIYKEGEEMEDPIASTFAHGEEVSVNKGGAA